MVAQVIDLRRTMGAAEDAVGARLLDVIGRAIADSITQDEPINVPAILRTLDDESRVIGRKRARAALSSAWSTHWDALEAALKDAAAELSASDAFDDIPQITESEDIQMTTTKTAARQASPDRRKNQSTKRKTSAAAPKAVSFGNQAERKKPDPIGAAFDDVLTQFANFTDLLLSIHSKRSNPKEVAEFIGMGLRELDDASRNACKARARIRRAFRTSRATAGAA